MYMRKKWVFQSKNPHFRNITIIRKTYYVLLAEKNITRDILLIFDKIFITQAIFFKNKKNFLGV